MILGVLCLFPTHSVLCETLLHLQFPTLVCTQSHQMHLPLHYTAPTMSCLIPAAVGLKLGSRQTQGKLCAKQGQRHVHLQHSNHGQANKGQESKAQHGAEYCSV